jgi:hypothetical protein
MKIKIPMKIVIVVPEPVKKYGPCAAWIGGVLLVGGLLWFFTQPLRSALLITSVNAVLTRNGETRLLESPLAPRGIPGKALGTWYTLRNTSERALVFSIPRGGLFASCVALVSETGTLEVLIPLSENAVQVLETLPASVLGTWRGRIEAASRFGEGGKR